MAIELEDLCALRPYLYHLTSRRNAERIVRRGSMESAGRLLEVGGRPDMVDVKRAESVTVEIDGEPVDLRDQAPLYEGNVEFEDGWDFARLLKALNQFVYFWPGKEGGPSDYGVRHFERYRAEQPLILRVPSCVLLDPVNRARVRLCRYNSGSPRASGGRKSPRGPRTFALPAEATFRGSEVVEITIERELHLTERMQFAVHPNGPWTALDSLQRDDDGASTLSSKRKGDIAELHVASVLLSDPALEVFKSACDDGLGSDLAVRSERTGNWYSIQVKATSLTANPFVQLSRFRATADYIVAAVVLDDLGLPERTYLVPGAAWKHDDSGALGRNDGGGRSGPYVEVRTMGMKYRSALDSYLAQRRLGQL